MVMAKVQGWSVGISWNRVVRGLDYRCRNQGVLNGRCEDRFGILGRTVHDGGALMRDGSRDVLHDGSNMSHRGFLDDALLVVDFRLGNQSRCGMVHEGSCMVAVRSWTGSGQSKDRRQHHL